MVKYWIVLLVLLIIPLTSAREYCCLGVACESYQSYTEAKSQCPYGFASSYSCAHRVNHDFCQGCCLIDGVKYTAFSMDQCEGIFHPGEDCSDVVVRARLRGFVTGSGTLDGVTVSSGDTLALTLPDGKFVLPLRDVGAISVSFADEQGRYATKTMSVSVAEEEDKSLGDIALGRSSALATVHGSSQGQTFVEGYVRRIGRPLSIYNISDGENHVMTQPNGYFKLTDPSGSITVASEGLVYNLAVPVAERQSSFVHILCNDTTCGIVASSSGTSTGSTGWDDDDYENPYIDFFLPSPPTVPGLPLFGAATMTDQRGCQEVLSCYDYDIQELCEADVELCGVSTYGCSWQGTFCKPVDALETAASAPCEDCSGLFRSCTPESCQSIGGACTYREGKCQLDEVRACGYQGCKAAAITEKASPVMVVRLQSADETASAPPPMSRGSWLGSTALFVGILAVLVLGFFFRAPLMVAGRRVVDEFGQSLAKLEKKTPNPIQPPPEESPPEEPIQPPEQPPEESPPEEPIQPPEQPAQEKPDAPYDDLDKLIEDKK